MTNDCALLIGRVIMHMNICEPAIEDSVQIHITYFKVSKRWNVVVKIDDELASEGEADSVVEALCKADLVDNVCHNCPAFDKVCIGLSI